MRAWQQICYPEKLVVEAFQLFHFRYTMHQQVYTHKAVKQVEFMVTDALVSANEHIRIPGSVTETHSVRFPFSTTQKTRRTHWISIV